MRTGDPLTPVTSRASLDLAGERSVVGVAGEPGPHLGLRGHRSAWRMNVATATGLAMNAVCEPSMVSVVAPIRCAMNRSASGEMALSCSETRNQDGLLFQPAAVAFSL